MDGGAPVESPAVDERGVEQPLAIGAELGHERPVTAAGTPPHPRRLQPAYSKNQVVGNFSLISIMGRPPDTMR